MMYSGDDMGEPQHAQTVIDVDILNKLKKKTKVDTTKGAINKAIYHYIKCKHTGET